MQFNYLVNHVLLRQYTTIHSTEFLKYIYLSFGFTARKKRLVYICFLTATHSHTTLPASNATRIHPIANTHIACYIKCCELNILRRESMRSVV